MDHNRRPRGDPASDHVHYVAPGLARLRVAFVNVYFVGNSASADEPWILVDAGLPFSASRIAAVAERRFGRRPAAIVQTHGHFDHVGALRTLGERWDVPVYAHAMEMPFLTGRSAYPPPDPTVGGGAMAWFSFLYPRSPVDLGARVRPLPDDGSVPGAPGWRWIHTPGHSPGHVSLFRDDDRVLVAGDAFVTVKQESASSVALQTPEIHGPPAYFTPDWSAARMSVDRLARLEPSVAATGHGIPMYGEPMRRALETLERNFDHLAVPARGRYVGRPALAGEQGRAARPELPYALRVGAAAGLAGAALLLLWNAVSWFGESRRGR